MVVVFVLVKNWMQSRVDINPGQPVDWNNPKVRVMQHIIPAVVNRIDSSLESTKISYLEGDPSDTITLVMDIEQFRYLRKRRGIWEHQGLFTEREIERKWARRPVAMREWEGLQFVVPIAVNAAFNASTDIRTVRFLIGDVESGRLTVCRVSVQAKRGSAKYDWRYDQRAKGYLAPVTPHGDKPSVSPTTGAFAEDPYDFEHQVAQMLRSRGLVVEVTGGPGDEGVDIIAYDNAPLTGGRYLVQCKRYGLDHKVGVAAVRELYGTVQEKRASKGILVTSSVFTHQALRFAEDKPLELIDGLQLSALIDAEHTPTTDVDSSRFDELGSDLGSIDLHNAIEEGQLLIIEGLLGLGTDVETKGFMGETPLHKALERHNTAVISLLLENGANVEARHLGYTPLHLAALRTTNPVIIAKLLEHGANVHARHADGASPLHFATGNRDSMVASLLLDYGPDIHSSDNWGRTPLYSALHTSKPVAATIELLLSHGADIEARDEHGLSPLLFYLSTNQNPEIEIVALLLEQGAKVNSIDDDHQTPLHHAAANAESGTVSLLLSHGSDINSKNNSGVTPLHYAAGSTSDPTVIQLLFDHGAHINVEDDNGTTPLHFAARQNRVSAIAATLLDHGARIDTKNRWGRTPLNMAVSQLANPEIVGLLLRKGADITNVDVWGDSPLHTAATMSNLDGPRIEAIQLLLENGADVNATGNNGNTPLHCAVEDGKDARAGAVAILIEYGADIGAENAARLTPYQLAHANGANDEMLCLLR